MVPARSILDQIELKFDVGPLIAGSTVDQVRLSRPFAFDRSGELDAGAKKSLPRVQERLFETIEVGFGARRSNNGPARATELRAGSMARGQIHSSEISVRDGKDPSTQFEIALNRRAKAHVITLLEQPQPLVHEFSQGPDGFQDLSVTGSPALA